MIALTAIGPAFGLANECHMSLASFAQASTSICPVERVLSSAYALKTPAGPPVTGSILKSGSPTVTTKEAAGDDALQLVRHQ